MNTPEIHGINLAGVFIISNDESKALSLPNCTWSANDNTTFVKVSWQNTLGQNIYVVKAQGALNFGGTIVDGTTPQGGSMTDWTSDPSAMGMNALKNMADLAFYMVRRSDGMSLCSFGRDHYSNWPENCFHPIDWSAYPIKIATGDWIDMNASGGNGYMSTLGGMLYASGNGWVWYFRADGL